MRPFVRWPRGLEKEIGELLPLVPSEIENYYDPYLGSGAMFFAVDARGQYFVNEVSEPLVDIYKAVKKGRRGFWHTLESTCNAWKSVEARIMGVQDSLLELAFDYRQNRFKSYPVFVAEVKDALKGIWYSDLFTFVIPDPMDFSMEFHHKVIEAVMLVAGKDMHEEMAVEEILTAMKDAIFNFMVDVYNNTSVDHSVRSGVLAFVLHYSKQEGLFYDDTGEMRPDYLGAEANRVYLNDMLKLQADEKFQAKMNRSHFWNVSGKVFLQKNRIGYDDFLFMTPQTEEELKDAVDYVSSPKCDTHWMIVANNPDILNPLTQMRGICAGTVNQQRNLFLVKNY